ncbi:MAG TPA: carboxypeptidase-like regulatory domain-containing protein [Polyangiaceae bacterium]|nr:carboxypeptidase-like regulatory domain-containing protein [Polyangiaceae bacterium]
MMRTKQRWVLGCTLLSSGLALSCGEIIGIKDLRGNSGGAGASGVGTGGVGTGGKTSTGGTYYSDGGVTTTGGRSGGGGSVGTGDTSAQAGDTGSTQGGAPANGGASSSGGGAGGTRTSGGATNDGGIPGEGGAGGNTVDDGAVRGHVIDFLGHPVPLANVTIGSTTVQTDKDGAFAVDEAPASYDVRLSVRPIINNTQREYTWIYESLSRRDPKLQVYYGVEKQNASNLNLKTKTSYLDDQHKTVMSFGSKHGSVNVEINYAEVNYLSAVWYGPRTIDGNAHYLTWSFTGNQDLPVAYQSYASTPASLANTGAAISVELTDSMFPVSSTQGKVESLVTASRRNWAFVHFKDNAQIPVVEDWSGSDTFSYLTPGLPDSAITVAASYGDWTRGAYAIAHKMVSSGSTGIELSIPAAPVLSAPTNAKTNVNGKTEFSWTGANAVHCLAITDGFKQAVYVVTTRKRVTIPDLDAVLTGNAEFSWSVEQHNALRTVDDATGADGFQDSFGAYLEEPTLYRANDQGFYASSESRTFTTAP